MLAGLDGSNNHGRVEVARSRNVDNLNVVPLDDSAPFTIESFPAKLRGRSLQFFSANPPANHFHPWHKLPGKEAAHLPVSVGMSPTHESVTDQCNVDFRHCDWSFVLGPLSFVLRHPPL